MIDFTIENESLVFSAEEVKAAMNLNLEMFGDLAPGVRVKVNALT